MAQIFFQWQNVASYAADDFMRSTANEAAVDFLGNWPEKEPSYIGLLTGPTGSGKTHLAHIWAERMHACFLPPAMLGNTDSATLWQDAPAAVLENIETADNTALFHLLRFAESQHVPLLLTCAIPLQQLPLTLPDLQSRLAAAPGAAILSPDDELLHRYFVKCFADRQWRVSDQVVQYVLKRIERSFTEAHALVAKMEQHLAEHNHDLTIAEIKSLL